MVNNNQIYNRIQKITSLIWVASLIICSLIFMSYKEYRYANANSECSTVNKAFKGGEELVYKLYYNLGMIWIPAGEAVFTVQETPASYDIRVTGKTYSSYENFFRVNDYFYSKVDKKTLRPVNFLRSVEEGNYRVYDSVYFDQNRNIAVSYHGKTKETARPQIHHLGQCMQDLVSNIYYMRNMDSEGLNVGENVQINLFFDKEVYPLSVKYSGKEKKKIRDLGEFRTIRIIPDVVSGNVFKKGDKIVMWVSDDQNRIPLLIESPVSVGSVKAVLKSYSGLKYTLDSQIKN